MKNLKKMKKGIFFSVISVFIIILFVAITELSTNFQLEQFELETTRTRLKLLNSLVRDMEDTYFEKMIYISTKNALIGLSKYYSETNFDQNRLQKKLGFVLDDVIYNNTLIDKNGNEIDLSLYVDPDYTIFGVIGDIKEVFDSLGLEVSEFTVSIDEDEIVQVDPWTIEVTGQLVYNFKDKFNTVSWKGRTTKKVNVSVIGITSFDYELSEKSNTGIITSSWVKDEGPYYTEPSVVDKLSLPSPSPTQGKGICSPNFNVNGRSCSDDLASDH